MLVEQINDEVVLRVPSYVGVEEIQRLVDLMRYKEATARSQASQEDVDKIVGEVKKGWWKKNRGRFIK